MVVLKRNCQGWEGVSIFRSVCADCPQKRNLCSYWLFYTFGSIYMFLQSCLWLPEYPKISNFGYPVPEIHVTENAQSYHIHVYTNCTYMYMKVPYFFTSNEFYLSCVASLIQLYHLITIYLYPGELHVFVKYIQSWRSFTERIRIHQWTILLVLYRKMLNKIWHKTYLCLKIWYENIYENVSLNSKGR